MRDFAAFCTLMAFLAVFSAAVVAMFKPLPKIGMGTRKRALGGFGVAFGLFILTGIVMPAPTEKSENSEQASIKSEKSHVAATEQSEPESSLGVDVDDFSGRFNDLAASAEKPWRIKNVQMKGNSFSYMLNDRIGFVGTVRPDKELTGVIVMGSGDGSVGSGVDVFMVMGMAYCAAAGIGDLKQCGRPILPLMQDYEEGDETRKSTINNIRLSYSRSRQLGNMLTISPVS